MRYLIGLIMLAVGFTMALKPNWFLNTFGKIDFANRGVIATFGGSRTFFQLIGIVLVILSVVVMFGRCDTSGIQGAFGK